MEKKLKNSCFFRLQFFCLFPILWFPFPIGFYLVAGMDNFFSFFDDHSMNQQQILDGCLYDWLVRFLQFCFFLFLLDFLYSLLIILLQCLYVCVCLYEKFSKSHIWLLLRSRGNTHTHTHTHTVLVHLLDLFRIVVVVVAVGVFSGILGKWEFECQIQHLQV